MIVPALELCQRQGVELVEGHALSDHVHVVLGIPPKLSVANTVGFLKGKSAIRIHREYLGRQRNFTGYHFWAKGYCVSTVGLAEEVIRDYMTKGDHVHVVLGIPPKLSVAKRWGS